MPKDVHFTKTGRCAWSGWPVRLSGIMPLLVVLLASIPATAFDFFSSLDTEVAVQNTTGPGSTTAAATRCQTDLRITGNQDDAGGSQLLSLGLSLGNDLGIGKRIFTLTSLKWEKTTPSWGLKLGDVLESFSQYSLTSSYKGLSYTHVLSSQRGLELIVVGGYAYPRWENIYAGKDVVAVAREVKGALLSLGPSSSGTLYGVSVVSSIDRSGIAPGDKLYNNLVFSLDSEFIPIPGLTMRASAAYSGTTETTNNAKTTGTAFRLDANSAAKQGRAVFEYERISPGFMTVMGSAVADREKIKLRITSNHSKNLTSTLGYLYTRDNLANQKSQTTINHKPEFSISMRRPFNRRYASFGTALKLDIKGSTGNMITSNTLSLDYKDRFGPIDTTVVVSRGASAAQQEMNYLAELSSRSELGAITLRPTLKLNIFSNRNLSNSDWKQTSDTALELRIELPSSNINSSMQIGQQTTKGTTVGPTKLYADVSMHYRPAFLSKLRDGRFFVRANYSGYSYSDVSQDKKDTSVKMGVSLSW